MIDMIEMKYMYLSNIIKYITIFYKFVDHFHYKIKFNLIPHIIVQWKSRT